jgi:hypothetical protein
MTCPALPELSAKAVNVSRTMLQISGAIRTTNGTHLELKWSKAVTIVFASLALILMPMVFGPVPKWLVKVAQTRMLQITMNTLT